jgi:excisionase family DNA binding protein
MSEEIKDNELLTDQEAAKLLKVSARTVQRLRLKDKLKPVYVTAKAVRVKRSDVEAYIQSGGQKRAA